MLDLKIGCCGFARGIKNYFKTFKVVEIQQTFYQIPKIETIKAWREGASNDFEFCVKAWQGITHPCNSPTYKRFKGELKKPENYGFFKQTDEVYSAWKDVENICSILKTKYILFQCPGSFKPTEENIDNLINFFKKIRNSSFYYVWEPRGEEWSNELILEICEKCNLIHATDPFNRYPATKDTAYFRLHGSPPGDKIYYYRYSEYDLKELLNFCKKFKTVYCFFNNISMYEDALRFIELSSKL